MLATKFMGLHAIDAATVPLMLVAAHALSRLMPVLVIFTSEYTRADLESKSKPIGQKGKTIDLFVAVFFGLALLAFVPLTFSIVIIPVMLITAFFFRNYIVGKLGGYTGDCLGALQQITEVLFYLAWVAFQNLTV
jgi:adenosylcobinamide-GDP ribazoletransferase